MIRLNVVVEGQTEETFVNRILAAELARHGVYVAVTRVTTSKDASRRRRGGGRSYKLWKKHLSLWMKQDQRPETWFTTMVDLYGLPRDFPGYQECDGIPVPDKRVRALEERFRADVNHRQFIPYIALHEFEALLFADVAKFLLVYPDRQKQIDQLAAVRASFKTVDEINRGSDTAPSKRICKVLPEYDKTGAAFPIAEAIGLERMCAESPHFTQWLEQLRALGQTQGTEG
jgi:hypothetical protein